MRTYKSKKIWLDYNHTKHVTVRMYQNKRAMQDYYATLKPTDKGCYHTLGVHIPHHPVMKGHTGTILMSKENCGAGIVSHELGHAALYAFNLKAEQMHPIVIGSMKSEEKILHMQTYAVCQFYDWFYKKIQPESK